MTFHHRHESPNRLLLAWPAANLEGEMQLTDEPDEFLQDRADGRRNYVTIAAGAAGLVMLSVLVVAAFSGRSHNEKTPTPVADASVPPDNTALERRKTELQAEVARLQQEIDRDSQDVAGLRAMAESARRELAALDEQRKAERAAIEALTQQREAEQAALDARNPTPSAPASAPAENAPRNQPGPPSAPTSAPPAAPAEANAAPAAMQGAPPAPPADTATADTASPVQASSDVYLHLARQSLQQGHADDALVALNEAENRLSGEDSRHRARNAARIRVARRAIYRGDVKRALRNIDAILRMS
jgi:hypothetical protein